MDHSLTIVALGVYELLEHEVVESMCSIYMSELDSEVVFVGTAIVNEEDKDQLPGRVLAFQVMLNYEYKLLDAVRLPGVVYSMKPYLGSIIMSVNGSVSKDTLYTNLQLMACLFLVVRFRRLQAG